MTLTVFAEMMGLFHKGSNGKGIAPLDVCLSPPPPPAGPVPIPYVNLVSASDLTKGSKTVKVDGEPTALEDVSVCSTSTGDEPGTQGGGVVSHKTKGKANFTLWSFTVKVEGKGVARHGDPLLQNTGSPPNCTAPGALTALKKELGSNYSETVRCKEPYDSNKHRPARTAEQRDAVNGKKCWECKGGTGTSSYEGPGTPRKMQRTAVIDQNGKKTMVMKDYRTHDHQPPLTRAWELGGCRLRPTPDKFLEMMGKAEFVRPHCKRHSDAQGTKVKKLKKHLRRKRR